MGLSRGGPVKRLNPELTTGFIPLVSQGRAKGGQSTSIAEGASWQISAYCARVEKKVPRAVILNLAWGGRSIAALSPGGEIYEDAIRAIDRVCTLLEKDGYTPFVEYVDFDQGEADSRSTHWASDVTSLRDRFNADVKVRTKQEKAIPWLLAQPSAFLEGCYGMVVSQYALCKSKPNEFIQSGASYHLPFITDLLHRAEQGHALKGEFNGLSFARTLYQRRADPVMQWNEVIYDESANMLRLTPSISVTQDKKINNPGNWGFNVYDGNDREVPILSVKTTGKGTQVVLLLAHAVLPGKNRRVDYALNSKHQKKRVRYDDRPRGQLKSKHPFGLSYHSKTPLHAYMPHSREYF